MPELPDLGEGAGINRPRLLIWELGGEEAVLQVCF